MAQETTDFYALLGVPRTASDEEIKRAYRARARELHPDANPGDPEAEERFKQVSIAYEVLKDPEKRRRYDQFGIDGIRGMGGGGGGAGDPFGFAAGGFADLFEAFFGGQNPFGGGGRRGPAGPPRGGDLEVTVDLGFEQAVFGTAHELEIRVPVRCEACDGSGAASGTSPSTCPDCQGSGELRRIRQSLLGQMMTTSPCGRCGATGQIVPSPCTACRGEGRRTEQRSYTVDVPAGVDTGTTLRLTGKGAAGMRGGVNGDLYVHVRVAPHPRFERSGYDLVEQLQIPVTQAALGAHLTYPTLDGDEDLVIGPGTQTGKVFRLRGRGVPHVNGRHRGDLLVQVVVATPTSLSKEQEEALRRFAELRGDAVAPPDHGFLKRIRSAFK